MATPQELDNISLTLIQAAGLLLPVVFLTFRFYLKGADRDISRRTLMARFRVFTVMIIFLTVTGMFASIGLFDYSVKAIFVEISVLSLAFFFASYGYFIYKITKWSETFGI